MKEASTYPNYNHWKHLHPTAHPHRTNLKSPIFPILEKKICLQSQVYEM